MNKIELNGIDRDREKLILIKCMIRPTLSPRLMDLPNELQLLAQMNQIDSSNLPDSTKRLLDGRAEGNFDWSSSKEGLTFWMEVEVRYGSYPSI